MGHFSHEGQSSSNWFSLPCKGPFHQPPSEAACWANASTQLRISRLSPTISQAVTKTYETSAACCLTLPSYFLDVLLIVDCVFFFFLNKCFCKFTVCLSFAKLSGTPLQIRVEGALLSSKAWGVNGVALHVKRNLEYSAQNWLLNVVYVRRVNYPSQGSLEL